MKIKKPNETKVIQEAEIPLGIMAGAKSFGKCGAHIVTPKKWTNGKTNLTVLAISAMLVLSYFTMSYQGPAFATIGGGRGGGGSNFDRGDGGAPTLIVVTAEAPTLIVVTAAAMVAETAMAFQT